jgi:tetratricopeptide (TPR) repeat protein
MSSNRLPKHASTDNTLIVEEINNTPYREESGFTRIEIETDDGYFDTLPPPPPPPVPQVPPVPANITTYPTISIIPTKESPAVKIAYNTLGTERKKLCLNMIVKNESRVITRLLESALKYIDCFCICDTGSTDNTIEIIKDFFEKQSPPIQGKIVQEPFRDFGYNRTFSLKQCEPINVEYILLLDADMILIPTLSKDEFYNRLKDDVYYLFQGTDTFFYKNVRIAKNNIGLSYWGVTHEYVKTPEGTVYNKFEKDEVFINDVGDGGCKSDKFTRDVQLLKKGLEDEPNNDRYSFYLANSYRDAGQYDNAIEMYKKRIELGGWFDEVWHSHYSIGKCYKYKGDHANAIYWWMEAYNYYPSRIENLYEIITYYRCLGKNTLAYGFYNIANSERNRNKSRDYLFFQKDVYDYKIDYELSIIGYYCNYNKYDLAQVSMKVLNYPFAEETIAKNVLSNYKFYTQSIEDFNILSDENRRILRTIGNSINEIQESFPIFVPSTPSVILTKEGKLVINKRFVDYRINDAGGYENRGTISTKNVIAVVDIEDENWVIDREFVLQYNKDLDNLYVGLEDVRLFYHNNQIYFNANRGLSYHNMKVEHGTIDLENESTQSEVLFMDAQREIEKNWVLFEYPFTPTTSTTATDKKMKIIYNWHPLVIGDIVQSETQSTPVVFNKTHEIKTPHFFKHVRGSTNGILIDNEIWFMCHTVSYEDRRYYYEIIIVLDAETFEIKKYTPFFTFCKEKVEYTLGMQYFSTTNEFLIGYSLMDKQTDFMLVEYDKLDSMMMLLDENFQ